MGKVARRQGPVISVLGTKERHHNVNRLGRPSMFWDGEFLSGLFLLHPETALRLPRSLGSQTSLDLESDPVGWALIPFWLLERLPEG